MKSRFMLFLINVACQGAVVIVTAGCAVPQLDSTDAIVRVPMPVQAGSVDPIDDRLMPVFYATNRNRTGSDDPYFSFGNKMNGGDSFQGLERGIAVVRIPDEHKMGELDTPSQIALTLRRNGVESTWFRIDPRKEFQFDRPLIHLTKTEFDETLRSTLSRSEGKTAVLYVHGYANDFTVAAFRAAQMAFDLKDKTFRVVPLLFSWPSDPGASGYMYGAAEKRVDVSAAALADFLREISAATDIGTIHIVAHSMGARVLANAMASLGENELAKMSGEKMQPRFREIVFAAADIEPEFFTKQLAPTIRSKHKITSYVATDDVALWLSRVAHLGVAAGATVAQQMECVDVVDVTSESKGLAHSTWAQSPKVLGDLRNLLRRSVGPAGRGLSSKPPREWAWLLPTEDIAPADVVGNAVEQVRGDCVLTASR